MEHAGGVGLGGAEREQILGGLAQEHHRTGTVLSRHSGEEPAHDRYRHLVTLSLDQIGRGGQLVRHGHLGDVQLVAVRVGLATVVPDRVQPGRAQGDVGQPVAPGTPHGVGDDDRDVASGPFLEGRP